MLSFKCLHAGAAVEPRTSDIQVYERIDGERTHFICHFPIVVQYLSISHKNTIISHINVNEYLYFTNKSKPSALFTHFISIAAELAAKKSRVKQSLIKRARSVAIFSLKLKERRAREAEKQAQAAAEHAKVCTYYLLLVQIGTTQCERTRFCFSMIDLWRPIKNQIQWN